MKIYLLGHSFHFEIDNIARLFTDKVEISEERPPQKPRNNIAFLRIVHCCGTAKLLCYVKSGSFGYLKRASSSVTDKREQEYALCGMLFEAFRELFGVTPPWGTVTGIRPSKYILDRKNKLGSWQAAENEFVGKCFMRRDKASLARETAENSEMIRSMSRPDSVSMYISIPFCPSRCSYCSFVSKTTERDGGKQLDQYVDCLIKEISEGAKRIKGLGLSLETLYIGGGTPTVLSAVQLERLLDAVGLAIDTTALKEYTVEAGRPDTIDVQKLKLIKQSGCTRLCINPQTFNDTVLKTIGRRHSASDIDEAFALARAVGFDNINADLIAGLPMDTAESFKNSLKHLLELEPQGITVHALTVKRSSNLREEGSSTKGPASEMVDYAYPTLRDKGYKPYYMYRQKSTVDNLENVGYALDGYACLYNVFIMEELHTIIACGAGGSTKLVDPRTGFITRVFNYKYPAEYISGFHEILKRKDKIDEFCQRHFSAQG